MKMPSQPLGAFICPPSNVVREDEAWPTPLM